MAAEAVAGVAEAAAVEVVEAAAGLPRRMAGVGVGHAAVVGVAGAVAVPACPSITGRQRFSSSTPRTRWRGL